MDQLRGFITLDLYRENPWMVHLRGRDGDSAETPDGTHTWTSPLGHEFRTVRPP